MQDINSIKEYFILSEPAEQVQGIFVDSADSFKERFLTLQEVEKASYIRHYISHNIPFVFKDKPLLFERIREYIAHELKISPSEVILIGSAKTGFSMGRTNYGRAYSKASDLDFAIINQELFQKLESDFLVWQHEYAKKIALPSNEIEKSYWDDHMTRLPKNIENCGFIDSHKIPNRYPTTQLVNNTFYKIGIQLEQIDYVVNKKNCSIRIYKNWDMFTKRVILNTRNIIEKGC